MQCNAVGWIVATSCSDDCSAVRLFSAVLDLVRIVLPYICCVAYK